MKSFKLLNCFAILLLLLTAESCKNEEIPFVRGVSSPVISLNGSWQVTSMSFDSIRATTDIKWKELAVPGECMMQGFPVKHDKPFTYRKEITIPADFGEKIVRLLFEGVYSHARVLKIEGTINTPVAEGQLNIRLFDPENRKVRLESGPANFSGWEFIIVNKITVDQKEDKII